MRLFLIFILCGASVSSAQPPVVASIDYYGLRKVSPERVAKTLGIEQGKPLPPSKGDLEERLEQVDGVVRSNIEAVCCSGDSVNVFVGIEERGAPNFAVRSYPTGEKALPQNILEIYAGLRGAIAQAARQGKASEDLRSGHALSAHPEARKLQEKLIEAVEPELETIRVVLRDSSDDEQRAIAAYVIGYAKTKRLVAPDLQYALQDPNEVVRANAMRSLLPITLLALSEPDLDIPVSATWMVEMLHSVSFQDRTKAVVSLLNLTDSRPEKLLELLKARGLDSLVEMARWHSLPHAIGPYMLLCRTAGLPDEEIEQSWAKGEREQVIAKILKDFREAEKNKPIAPPPLPADYIYKRHPTPVYK